MRPLTSIGCLWIFPGSQRYAEAGRLVRRELVVERQEQGVGIGAPCLAEEARRELRR
ncbi:hypothetical protein [Actinacidiphila glaucinigra]|uniref:hypothetical protein n=1 Tax=Actinacidiphila glaucinigra TaxID=235986 RepID=UPI0035D79483